MLGPPKGTCGRRWLFSLCGIWFGFTACRDATDATGLVPERVVGGLPRQLTFSVEDEHSPQWSSLGDSVYYVTQGIPPFPEIPGLLLGLSVQGGSARPLFPEVQLPEARLSELTDRFFDWFDTPTLAPDGDRIGYVDLDLVWPPSLCPPADVIQCEPAGAGATAPRLGAMVVRVRPTGSRRPVAEEPSLRVRFQGRTIEVRNGSPVAGSWIVRYYPFHQLFNIEGSRVFRPSWAPDGKRLVYSDGLGLHIWTVDSGLSEAIPNTEHAVLPAWSPDGRWIAFTRLEYGDSVRAACSHSFPSGPGFFQVCSQARLVFPLVGRTIAVVRPDGSGLAELWAGDEPAWAPDSETLVYRNEGRLWLATLSKGDPQELAGTSSGREPSVSPDGSLLAFTKVGPTGSFDVWVMAF